MLLPDTTLLQHCTEPVLHWPEPPEVEVEVGAGTLTEVGVALAGVQVGEADGVAVSVG